MALDPAAFVKRYENPSGNPYLGTGRNDLTSYVQSGNVNQYGFPNWAGISTPLGVSTAAGNYQFTRSTWNRYAKAAGVTDFSPESQDKVFAYAYNQNGLGDYTCKGCNPVLLANYNALGGASAFEPRGSYSVPGDSNPSGSTSSGGGFTSTLTMDPADGAGTVTGSGAGVGGGDTAATQAAGYPNDAGGGSDASTGAGNGAGTTAGGSTSTAATSGGASATFYSQVAAKLGEWTLRILILAVGVVIIGVAVFALTQGNVGKQTIDAIKKSAG